MTDITIHDEDAAVARRRVTAIEKRRVHKLLEEHLDCDAKEYRGDWTDEKIATAAGVRKEGVVYLRRIAYCNLRTHESRQIKRQDNLDEIERRLEEALTVMTDAKLGNFGQALQAVRSQVDSIREQVEAAREQMRSLSSLLALPGKVAALEDRVRALGQERALTR